MHPDQLTLLQSIIRPPSHLPSDVDVEYEGKDNDKVWWVPKTGDTKEWDARRCQPPPPVVPGNIRVLLIDIFGMLIVRGSALKFFTKLTPEL